MAEMRLLFTPVSITTLIDTEDARFTLNGISPIAKGDLKWRDALLFTGTVNSNEMRLPILTFLGNSGKIATICDMSVEQG